MVTSDPDIPVPPREPMPMVPCGPCWVCGGTALDRVWSDPFDLTEHHPFGPYAHADHPPSWVVRCRACGFGQPESLPALPDYFDIVYHWPRSEGELQAEFEQPYRDFIYRSVLDGLRARLGAGVPRTLLDVGAGTGRFLHLALRDGWRAEGVELSPPAAAYAARRTGASVHAARAQELITQGRRFGAVTLNDVLEHIPRPIPMVAQLRDLLHPGGVLAIKVPHGPMQRLKERVRLALGLGDDRVGVMVRFAHVNHFTVGSLRRCLAAAGFRRIEIGVGAPEFQPASAPGRTRAQAASALVRRAAYTATRLAGARTLAFNLQAYATRPD